MNKYFLILFVAIFVAGGCNNQSDDKKSEKNDMTGKIDSNIVTDTLPDTPQFTFTVDGEKYTVADSSVKVYYTSSDSTLTIQAATADSMRLDITIWDVRHTPGYRGNAWRSDNTKLAGSDSLVYRPTVGLYKGSNANLSSWQNLDDGFHPKPPQENKSLYIYPLRQTGERNFIIKGRINTQTFKNVYEKKSGTFNKDHKVEGKFVIQFEDYWLKL